MTNSDIWDEWIPLERCGIHSSKEDPCKNQAQWKMLIDDGYDGGCVYACDKHAAMDLLRKHGERIREEIDKIDAERRGMN